MPIAEGLYKGFSSFEFQSKKNFEINDVELVKLDLLNHIFTKRGERVMLPNFGTVIPEMVFEPLDDSTVEILQEEVLRVIEFDPRVELLEIRVEPDFERSSVFIGARVFYVELNLVDDIELNIQFEA